LAAWQQTTFPVLRPKPTPFLDELADDLLADVEVSRSAIERARARLNGRSAIATSTRRS
jgi:hypothetical protein